MPQRSPRYRWSHIRSQRRSLSHYIVIRVSLTVGPEFSAGAGAGFETRLAVIILIYPVHYLAVYSAIAHS